MIVNCIKCGDKVDRFSRKVSKGRAVCFDCKLARRMAYQRAHRVIPTSGLTYYAILEGEMTKRYEKFFQRNVHNLQEMLTLYEDGWSSVALGRKYNCDHTSILYQVKKHGVTQKRVRVGISEQQGVLYYPIPHKTEKGKYDHLIEEKVNPGKSYLEYVEDRTKRHPISKIKDNLPQGVQMDKVRFPHNAHTQL